jgi:hypothetical protein
VPRDVCRTSQAAASRNQPLHPPTLSQANPNGASPPSALGVAGDGADAGDAAARLPPPAHSHSRSDRRRRQWLQGEASRARRRNVSGRPRHRPRLVRQHGSLAGHRRSPVTLLPCTPGSRACAATARRRRAPCARQPGGAAAPLSSFSSHLALVNSITTRVSALRGAAIPAAGARVPRGAGIPAAQGLGRRAAAARLAAVALA